MALTKVQSEMSNATAPAFSAYLSGGNQSVTSSTWTKVQLNAEDFDTANAFDSTTNFRFQPTVAGYYQINFSVYFSGSNYSSDNRASVYKNGAAYKSSIFSGASANVNVSTQGNGCLVYLNGSTDYLELWGFTTNASSPIFAASSTNTYLNGTLVRPA